MSTESLIIELDAKTAKLDAKIKQTENRLDDLDGGVGKVDSSFTKFTKTGVSVVAGMAKLATVTLAVSAAISAMVLSSASNRRELELLSKQAKTSTEDFQALAFATKTYGVNAEQIADISKDISDKVAEFSIAGTGAFQDYADSIKLTKEEAREVATEFSKLSSQEVIGKMVTEMEKAGLSSTDMTFALESLGNDLSKIQPLFASNSKELSTLKARFDEVNSSLQVTDDQAAKLKQVSDTYSLMTTQIGNATTAISASLAPAMDQFFNDVISIVPSATQAMIDFINTFKTADDISGLVNINAQIEISKEKLDRLSPVAERVGKLREDNATTLNILSTSQERAAEKEFDAELKRFNILKANKREIEETIELQKIADAEKQVGGSISGVVDSSGVGTGDELQAIADRFKSEEDLLVEKLNRELIIVGDNDSLQKELHEEYLLSILELDQQFEDASLQLKLDSLLEQEKAQDDAAKKDNKRTQKEIRDKIQSDREKTRSEDAYMMSANIIGNELFENNKAVQAGLIITNAAVGITRQFADLPYPAALATSAAIGVTAAVQLASLQSASSGGGGSISSSVSNSPQSQPIQADFEQETTSLELSDSSGSGSQAVTVNFGTESGDDLIDAIATALNKAQREGRA